VNELIQIQKCLVPNCGCRSDENAGRAICVEPDNDGWICERCWINLHQPPQVIIQPVVVQLAVSVSIGKPTISYGPQ
jgi:hypothetical protein